MTQSKRELLEESLKKAYWNYTCRYQCSKIQL